MHLPPPTPGLLPRVPANKMRPLTTCSLIRLCPRDLTYHTPLLHQRMIHSLRSGVTHRIVVAADKRLKTSKCELLMALCDLPCRPSQPRWYPGLTLASPWRFLKELMRIGGTKHDIVSFRLEASPRLLLWPRSGVVR